MAAMPVVDDDKVVGVVGRKRLVRLGRRRFGGTRVERGDGRAAAGAGAGAVATRCGTRVEAMNEAGSTGSRSRTGDALAGLVTRDSLADAIRSRAAAQAARRMRHGDGRPTRVSGRAAPRRGRAGDGAGRRRARWPTSSGSPPRPRWAACSPRRSWPRVVAAAVGQLGDGRLRDPRGRRRRGHRGRARPARRSSARSRGGRRPTRAVMPGRRSGSRPARRCRPAPTPWSRSRARRRSTRRAAAGPRGRDAAGPAARGDPRPRGGRGRRRRSAARAATSRPARRSLDSGHAVTPAVVALAAGAGRRRASSSGAGRSSPSSRPATRCGPRGPTSGRPGSRTPTARGSGRSSRGRRRPARARDRRPTGSRTSRRGCGAASTPARTSSWCRAACRSGPYDVVRTAFDGVGQIDLWRVAVQPGKPFAFGRADVDGRRHAGRCCSACRATRCRSFVTFELFVRPVIRRLAGQPRAASTGRSRGPRGGRVQEHGRRGYQRVTSMRDADGLPVRDDAAGSACASRAGRGATSCRRSPPRMRSR